MVTDKMIEAAAMAIHNEGMEGAPWEHLTDSGKEMHRELAKAALEAAFAEMELQQPTLTKETKK